MSDVPIPDRGDGVLSANDVSVMRDRMDASGFLNARDREFLASMVRRWPPQLPGVGVGRSYSQHLNEALLAVLDTDPRAGWELVERLKRM